MAHNLAPTLPLDKLYEWEAGFPDEVFLRQPYPGKGYQDLTWKQAVDISRRIAMALTKKNLKPGSHIAILSKNCAHWLMADYAIWMAGHVSVPLYPNLAGHTVRQILEHSDSVLAFIGKLDDVTTYREAVPDSIPCIAFPFHDMRNAEKWDDLVEQNTPLTAATPRKADDIATIIYTSGTTGEPKGVIHSFLNIAAAGTEIARTADIKPRSKFFSYLPLAHVAERILVQTASLYSRGSVAFVESLNSFANNLQEIQPTVFLAVPRLWLKFQTGILAKMPQKKLSILLRIPGLSSIIKRKLRHKLGLSQAQIIVSGGSATPVSLMEWFKTLGIEIQEAYGMSENFAFSHYNRVGDVAIGSVGTPWPGIKQKIGEGDEILVASPASFLGYYKRENERASSFEGEYLKTGDVGRIAPDGHLFITGRTKDLFKTSKGKYVAPSPIELALQASPLIESVCVVGADLAQPLALVVLAPDVQKTDAIKPLEQELKKVNATLDPHEKLSRIVIMKEQWTVESGTLTPTLKLKRNVIEAKYGSRLSEWESSRGWVVLE